MSGVLILLPKLCNNNNQQQHTNNCPEQTNMTIEKRRISEAKQADDIHCLHKRNNGPSRRAAKHTSQDTQINKLGILCIFLPLFGINKDKIIRCHVGDLSIRRISSASTTLRMSSHRPAPGAFIPAHVMPAACPRPARA